MCFIMRFRVGHVTICFISVDAWQVSDQIASGLRKVNVEISHNALLSGEFIEYLRLLAFESEPLVSNSIEFYLNNVPFNLINTCVAFL